MRKVDGKLYREMSVPFASTEESSAAIDAFFDDLYELRKKHRIADVFCVVQVNALTDGDREGPRVALYHIGDSLKSLPLAAYGYGSQVEGHSAMLAEILAAPRKQGRRPRTESE